MKNEELDPPPLVIPALGSLASHTDEASRPEIHERPAARDPYQFGAVNKAPAIEPDRIELNLEASEETGSQALALKDQTDWSELGGGRFSVILAPGRPLNLSPIIGIMAKTLGLSQKGAYQALLHRRGILAENLPLSEAGRVSEDFAQAGHPVLLVAMTSRLQFGEGLDLVTIQEHADRIVLTTVAQTITAAWSQIVFLAAGQVSLTPGMASRTVLDLFLIQPRHHLRLWENSFVHGPVAPRFRPTVEMIATRAGKAIHTHSLDRWWHGEKNALHEFSSMIEYEHYLRWHLMAHLAPTRMVGGD